MSDKLGDKAPENTNIWATAWEGKESTKVVSDTATFANEIVEAWNENINWWTTTEKNERWISDLKENHEALFNQLKWKIQFEWELIIIDWMKFDSKPLDFIWYFDEANNKAKEIDWRRLPLANEFEKLFKLFRLDWRYYGNKCLDLLSITPNGYWSSTPYDASETLAWYGYFWAGRVSINSKAYYIELLCIHD
jgi:hypothetical protein